MGPGMGVTPAELRLAAESMTLLDYFAIHAPAPNEDSMSFQRTYEKLKALKDDRYQAKDDQVLECRLRYRFAKEMMDARQEA